MSIQYIAETVNGTYTITRDIAGGPFTPRHNGEPINPAGRLRSARAAAFRHNGGTLDWADKWMTDYKEGK
jgi:hypothetical protein